MKKSYRQVLVGGLPAGLLGLDELFEVLYEQGRRPEDPGLEAQIVRGVREDNYIPQKAVDAFGQALCREYARYVDQRDGGGKPKPVDYGTWRGRPREQVPWFPSVAGDVCDGCEACLRFCQFGVFESMAGGKVAVVQPFRCVVGCSSCASVCQPGAITFPSRTILTAL